MCIVTRLLKMAWGRGLEITFYCQKAVSKCCWLHRVKARSKICLRRNHNDVDSQTVYLSCGTRSPCPGASCTPTPLRRTWRALDDVLEYFSGHVEKRFIHLPMIKINWYTFTKGSSVGAVAALNMVITETGAATAVGSDPQNLQATVDWELMVRGQPMFTCI